MKIKDTGTDFFKISPRALIPLTIVVLVYCLWTIQPVMMDDWMDIHRYEFFRLPCLPADGQQIRYCFDGQFILTTNPFSLFRPWSLFTAIFVVTLIWKALSYESLIVRSLLTLLGVLGFPFLGHIGPWNLAASEYSVSVFWTVLWYLVYKKVSGQPRNLLLLFTLFCMTFIAATWYEVWIVTFVGIISFLGIDSAIAFFKKDPSLKNKSLIFCISAAAYLLVVLFYLHKGVDIIDTRYGQQVGYTKTLFHVSHFLYLLPNTLISLYGLLTRFFPVLLLMLYIKINKQFATKLENDFGLFSFSCLGAIAFMSMIIFLQFPFIGRTKLLILYVFAVWAFAFPQRLIDRWLCALRIEPFRKAIRSVLLGLVILMLSQNIYFTYIYTNVDVKGWLQYRKMVASHDPAALDGFCCRSLLFFRPGIPQVWWSQEWGEQDDQYRFYNGPKDFEWVKRSVLAYWGEK